MAGPESSSRRSRTRAIEPTSATAQEIAEYIASLTAELAAMAGAARLDMLTYFLNMARLEAEALMRDDD